ncbi:MAG TPA: hypothetical protein VFB22_18320 [Candidatus Baltobacteraceae bacterium]|nr:hypothetical protein [Candidatus Baltobacteraceae bacterium]
MYVATAGADMDDARERIRRELEQFGHTVLPHDEPRGLDAVRRDLALCVLAIHPVGRESGPTGGEDARPAAVLQYEAALGEAARRRTFRRLPWMRPNTVPADDAQRAFVERLQDDPELLVGSLETLKSAALDVLRAARPAPAPGPRLAFDASRPTSIYLVCDPVDAAASVPLEDALYDCGFDVIRPLTDGDERQLREDHEENLRSADGVLIFHGATSELWLRTKLRDLRKAFGYGRRRPFAAAAVVLADPRTPDKAHVPDDEAIVIDAFGPFESWVLAPFVEQLANASGRTG